MLILETEVEFDDQYNKGPARTSTVITITDGDLKGSSTTLVGIRVAVSDPKPPIIDPDGNELFPITGGGGGGTDGGSGGGDGSGSDHMAQAEEPMAAPWR